MKVFFRITACFLALSCTVSAGVVAPDAIVGGKTVGEWTAEWWKWGFSFPVPGPLDDTTGELAHFGDVGGPVFFLSASGGSPTNLTFTVPGVCPIRKNRESRRPSASNALIGKVSLLRPPGCAT